MGQTTEAIMGEKIFTCMYKEKTSHPHHTNRRTESTIHHTHIDPALDNSCVHSLTSSVSFGLSGMTVWQRASSVKNSVSGPAPSPTSTYSTNTTQFTNDQCIGYT